jgi:hypothetical protein
MEINKPMKKISYKLQLVKNSNKEHLGHSVLRYIGPYMMTGHLGSSCGLP